MAAHQQLGRLARWGFPLVSIAAVIVNSVLVPRLLQLRLSDAEYVAYVTVMAVVAYMGLADGGLQWSITRELSAAHGAGDAPRFAGEVRRARRAFGLMTLIGIAIAVLGAASAYRAAQVAWPGANTLLFQLAVGTELIGSALMLGLGSYCSVLYYSTGRLLSGQLVSFTASVAPVVVFIVALVATRSLAPALFAHAAAIVVIAIELGLRARRLSRREIGAVVPSAPAGSTASLLGAGAANKFADVLPNAAFPHLLSILATAYVPAAIPARTFVNASRLFGQHFLGLLQIHITRRLAAGAGERDQGLAQFRSAAIFLTAVHLVQLGLVAGLLEPVVRLWLPTRAEHIAAFVPGMLLEQALLAAAIPSSILFTALGHLTTYGVVRLGGALLGLATFVVTLPHAREAAFGYGLAASAVPHYLLGLYCEVAPMPGFPPRNLAVVSRYSAAAAAATACYVYAEHPFWASIALGACGLVLLPRPALALWRMFHGVAPTAA